jgi:hypothetical protein
MNHPVAAVPAGAPSRRTVVTFLLTSTALAAGLGAALPAAAQTQALAGRVVRVRGEASATWSGLTRALVAGASVFVGDEIRTGAATRLEIRLGEGTKVTLGDHSTMVIEGAETAAVGGIIAILKGVFLGATRAIADLGRDSLTIRTSSAVLGVRGTVVWGEQQADKLGVNMLEGTLVTVTTPDLTVFLTTPLDGTDIVAGQPPTPPRRWGDARLAASRAAVAF